MKSSHADLRGKLFTALDYVTKTCVLGSDNKIADVERTGGWVFFQKNRYHQPGTYMNLNAKLFTYEDDIINAYRYDSVDRQLALITHFWFYHTEHLEKIFAPDIFLFKRKSLDPFKDPRFRLSVRNKYLLCMAMLVMQKKQGNCLERSFLLSKYLWEHSEGIKKIEIVSTETFDHSFVIVNRVGKKQDFTTWGEAFIVDPWYGEQGIIYPACEFPEKIQTIKAFAKSQLAGMKKIGIAAGGTPYFEGRETIGEWQHVINPDKDLYPTYSMTPFYPVEYYYELGNIYSSELWNEKGMAPLLKFFRAHKVKFKPCLAHVRYVAEEPLIVQVHLPRLSLLHYKQQELLRHNGFLKKKGEHKIISQMPFLTTSPIVTVSPR